LEIIMPDLNEQQMLFLSLLFDAGSPSRGNSLQSCIEAGYSATYHAKLVRTLKEEIRDRTHDQVASLGSKAIMGLEAAMNEDGSVPKGDIRLKASESVLDRMGIAKQQALDITSKDESLSPLFILPAKAGLDINPEYDDYDESADDSE
jgi:hypothetical protein